MRLQLHTTGIEPVTYSLQILRHTMVAAIVQTRLYVFGRSIDFDFDRCRGQFVSTRPMPIPLNFGIAASLVLTLERFTSVTRHHNRASHQTDSHLLLLHSRRLAYTSNCDILERAGMSEFTAGRAAG